MVRGIHKVYSINMLQGTAKYSIIDLYRTADKTPVARRKAWQDLFWQ